ncbi:MAG TPA: hypothetical protein DCG12_23195 [Planctomycetaceae bacterium]|nr:hypothetical protein [Planctomycetaceae bacterium]
MTVDSGQTVQGMWHLKLYSVVQHVFDKWYVPVRIAFGDSLMILHTRRSTAGKPPSRLVLWSYPLTIDLTRDWGKNA